MSEMNSIQFKLATVVKHLVPKSPRFGGDLRFAALPDPNGIRVDWNDVDLKPQSFEIRLHEIEKCQGMEPAIKVVLDKMGPGHTVTHQRRKTTALTPDKAPAYSPSIDPAQVFQQRVVACDHCETIGEVPGMKCKKAGCKGTFATYRVVQPKFPGRFKPFKEKIEDANQLPQSQQPGAGPGGRPRPAEGYDLGVDLGEPGGDRSG